MRCRNCNTENPQGARFCGRCGQPLGDGYEQGSQGQRDLSASFTAGGQAGKRRGKALWIGIGGVLLLLAAAAALLLVLGPRRDAKEMEQLLARGDRYLEEMDYDEAAAQYQEAIVVDPKREEPYLKLAEIYTKQNQPEKAAKILEEGKRNTRSQKIEEKYSLYSYVDDVLIPEIGQCQEGEYICDYLRTESYIGVDSVHSQKGVLTSRILDFDGDGKEELLVLILKNDKEYPYSEEIRQNEIYIQMYEQIENEIVLQDEYGGLGPVLGYGDRESDGVFLKENQGKIYLCASTSSTAYTYADGVTYQSCVLSYEEGAFVFHSGQREVTAGSDFAEKRAEARSMADFLEGIGLPMEAAQIRESYIEVFAFTDDVDDMLLRITGENDGSGDIDRFYAANGADPEYLGKVVLSLQLTWEKDDK